MTGRGRSLTFDGLPSEIRARLAGRVWAEMRLGRSKEAAKAIAATAYGVHGDLALDQGTDYA